VSGAWHVLHDDVGVSQNIFAHGQSDGTRVKIVEISRDRADDNGHSLALIIGSLGVEGRHAEDKNDIGCNYFCHL
jgi:hypothetical protein